MLRRSSSLAKILVPGPINWICRSSDQETCATFRGPLIGSKSDYFVQATHEWMTSQGEYSDNLVAESPPTGKCCEGRGVPIRGTIWFLWSISFRHGSLMSSNVRNSVRLCRKYRYVHYVGGCCLEKYGKIMYNLVYRCYNILGSLDVCQQRFIRG